MLSTTSLLIIEDQPEICELIKLSLINHVRSIQIAHSIKEATAQIKQASFTFAIIDSCLPDGNPYPLIQKLFQKQCRILLISGNFQVNQYTSKLPFPRLEKPFRIKDLIQKVEETLRIPLPASLIS